MIINTDTICRVSLFTKELHRTFSWEDRKTFLGFEIQPAGIYGLFSEMVTDEFLKEHSLYLEDGKVYYEPHIEIHMADGKCKTKWFDTEDAAVEFYANLKKQIKHIEI
jgi:hypothetical protein